jgi:hypothetical protein
MVTARTAQEQLVLDFFRILSSGDLEAIRATRGRHSWAARQDRR